jgi:signal transduction histidine kinase
MLQLQRTVKASGLAQQNLTKGLEKQLPGVIRNHRRLRERVEELRVSYEKAQEESRAKTDFIKTLSHELPMPIHMILGCGELLLDGSWGMLQESQKTIVVKMTQNACYLFDLITDLIELNRLNGGRDAARFDRFDVRRFLKEVEAMTRFMPKAEGVVFESKIPPGLPALFSDWDRLKIILRNIVGNAIKFTKNGQITVAARFDSREQMMELSVRDTGVGIDEKDQRRIFDMFWQGDNSHARPFRGAGLGLYIVKRLADQIGAKIAVESEKGKGSLFRLRIPVRPH